MAKTPAKHLLGYLAVALGVAGYFTLTRAPARAPQSSPTTPAVMPKPIVSPPPPPPVEAPKPDPCDNLYPVVCGRRGIIEDITGVVEPDVKGELDALRLYEKLLHEHPATSEEVDDAIVAELYTPPRRKRLNEVFDWVKRAMIHLIESQPRRVFPPAAKKELVRLLQETKLELPPPANLYKDELDVFTKNDVFYETLTDGRRVIRVGGAYLLTAKSWFNRVFTFAHELAHAIDPCDADPSAPYLSEYAKVERCFAKHAFTRSRHGSRCEAGDQTSETFADWIGAQITAEAIRSFEPKFKTAQDSLNAIINSVRDLCNEESWLEYNTESYPEPQVRIQVIYGHNPEIRRLLGCLGPKDGGLGSLPRFVAPTRNKEPAYCGFE